MENSIPSGAHAAPAPKVSVVTVTRNNLGPLKGTVASVLEQTYRPIEYLVVDGLSSDGTVQFLKDCGDKIKWFSEADSGIGDAFNKGLDRFTGDLVLFMNAGDEFLSAETVAQAVASIPPGASVNGSIFYGNYYEVDEGIPALVITNHERLGSTNSINHQSAFVGSEVARRFRYDERLFLGMDYDYWLRCRRAGIPFVKLDLPVARFQLGGRSHEYKYWVHNATIRCLLRYINSGKVISLGNVFALAFAGVDAFARTSLFRFVSRRKLRTLARMFRGRQQGC